MSYRKHSPHRTGFAHHTTKCPHYNIATIIYCVPIFFFLLYFAVYKCTFHGKFFFLVSNSHIVWSHTHTLTNEYGSCPSKTWEINSFLSIANGASLLVFLIFSYLAPQAISSIQYNLGKNAIIVNSQCITTSHTRDLLYSRTISLFFFFFIYLIIILSNFSFKSILFSSVFVIDTISYFL